MRNRRWGRFIGVAVTSVALFVATGVTSAGASPKSASTQEANITIGAPVVFYGNAPVYVARTFGYLKKAKIGVKFATIAGGDPAVAAAVESGSVQFGSTFDMTLLQLVKKGLPLVAVVGLNVGLGPMGLALNKTYAAQHGISGPGNYKTVLKKLRGASIGVLGVDSSSGDVLKGMLSKAGLPTSWINLVTVTATAQVAGVQHGSLDGLFGTPPFPELARKIAGAIIACTSSQIPELKKMMGAVLYTSQSYLKSHRAVVKKFVQTVDKANNAILNKSTQKRALKVMYKVVTSQPPATVKSEVMAGIVKGGGLTAAREKLTEKVDLSFHVLNAPMSAKQLKSSYTITEKS